jgi:hypothetical protein
MRENRQSGSEGGGAKPIASPYPYHKAQGGAGPPAGQPRWGAEAKRNPGLTRERIRQARETGDRGRGEAPSHPLARDGNII